MALQLGMTVGELSERMTAAEEAHWIALCSYRPFADERIEYAIAQLTQTLHNAHFKPHKEVTDFLYFRDKPPRRGDDAQTIRANFNRLIAGQRK